MFAVFLIAAMHQTAALAAGISTSGNLVTDSSQNITLTANVTGVGPYVYQWYSSPYPVQQRPWNTSNASYQGTLISSLNSTKKTGWQKLCIPSTKCSAKVDTRNTIGNGSILVSLKNTSVGGIQDDNLDVNLSKATNIYLWVYTPNASLLQNQTTAIELDLTPNANYSGFFACQYDGGGLRNGWNPIVLNKSACPNYGDNISWNAPIISSELLAYPKNSSVAVSVDFADLRYNYNGSTPQKAVVMINFDDGYANVINEAYPVLKADNLTATAFVLPALLNSTTNYAPDYMNLGQLHKLYNSGWDIASHTMDHLVGPLGLTNSMVNQSHIDWEINGSYSYLINNGFTRSAIFFAYPDGAYNATIIQEVKNAGYKMAKYGSGDSLDQPNLYGDDPFNLTYSVKATDVTNNYSVNDILTKIDSDIVEKGLLIITFHQVYNVSGKTNNISAVNISTFTAVANYLKMKQAAGELIVTNFSTYNAMINQTVYGATNSTLTVSPKSSGYYYYEVKDEGTGETAYSRSIFVTVNEVEPSLKLSNRSIDAGQSILLTASLTSGTGSYNYTYYIVNSITNTIITSETYSNVNSTSNSFIWTPGSDFYTQGNDFKANVVISNQLASLGSRYMQFSYQPALSPTISASVTPTLAAGQYELFVANAGGGTSPYIYDFSVFDSETNAVIGSYISESVNPSNTYVWTASNAYIGSEIYATVSVTDHPSTPTTANSTLPGVITIINSTSPKIFFQSPIYPTNSTNSVIVHVSGTGFHQNSTIVFGYGTSKNNSTVRMLTEKSDMNGNWTGTFTSPWSTGSYTMYAQDAQNTVADATMVVIARQSNTYNGTPQIIFQGPIYPTNSTNSVIVHVSGTGFHPNSTVVFGYGTSKSNSTVRMIDTQSDMHGNWTGTFTSPWSTGSYEMYAQDAQNALADADMVVTKPQPSYNGTPEISFQYPIYLTNASDSFIVHVNGTGFHPNSTVIFGYGTSKSNSTVRMLTEKSDMNGNWTGTFTSPWSTGSYEMYAQDAQNTVADADMVVTKPQPSYNGTPEISFQYPIYPTNSTNSVIVHVSGTGFHPNSTVVFGYGTSKSNSTVRMIDTQSDMNGNWTGTFTSPWSTGSYEMYAQDAQNAVTDADMVVTAP